MCRLTLSSLMLLLLCAAPIAAQHANAAGTWDATITSPQGTFNVQLILKQDADKVTGVIKSQRGETPVEGTTTAKEFDLKYTIKFQENDLAITLSGAIDATTMKGTADFGGMAQGDFNAKRAADTPTVAAAPATTTTNVTGTWALQVETANGTGTPTFKFEQQGEKLSGQYKGAFGEAPVTGTVKDNKIEFTIKVEAEGQPVTITYNGTIEKDGTLKGTVKLGDAAAGTWTGKRQ